MGDDVSWRIKQARERAGMSRPVLGGLVGRSAEWVKAVETGRLQTPKLHTLIRLAKALDIADLAELTGNHDPVQVSRLDGVNTHSALQEVQTALTTSRFRAPAGDIDLSHLGERLRSAWTLRHASPDHRTKVGRLLPALIRDAQDAVRAQDGPQRRQARRLLAGVHLLANFYVAYQPAPELVWLVVDRAVTEAHEADDPQLIGGAAWAMVQVLRESGRWDEALEVATGALRLLAARPEDDEWNGMRGALLAECALTWARKGRLGEALRYWDLADTAARTLGPGYRHVQSSFSVAVLRAHAVSINVDLRRGGEALRAERRLGGGRIASVPRRARHLIEIARAHEQQDDRQSTLATLREAHRTAPETTRFNGWARELSAALLENPPTGEAAAARELARGLQVS
ncbi:helix-turn-helix transcriptional regulator [Saccharopolyspora sp. 6V]|uniref:helix-turn-helix domain-containing protein n=1 Tax=Saccharopolyspora sp. 6V TaxID=2877239 RepID=UPI001CD680AA|nr:helix-turn-helix transcriptional regulator [Saccharopolyspora sp. 6V]MCA1193062.1 helix-turn-helix domain-containing protein [Saccharopolyspora sp. 6V]